MKFSSFLTLASLLFWVSCGTNETVKPTEDIDLAGEWTVVLDSLNVGEEESWNQQAPTGQSITMPSTLDEANIGTPNALKPALNNSVLSHLIRKHEYIGAAWYSRTFKLPADYDGTPYVLELERVLWESKVWVNGQEVGTDYSLVAPHRYTLAEQLQPGENQLTIRIDNSDFYPGINVTSDRYPVEASLQMAHAYTNHTQIKWNGILGDISLKKVDDYQIEELTIYSNPSTGLIAFVFGGSNYSDEALPYSIRLNGEEIQSGTVATEGQDQSISGSIQLEKEVQLWDEFHPNLYELTLGDSQQATSTFGFTTVGSEDRQLTLNGTRIYLRGTLECSIFPLTGRPPLEKSEWLALYKKAKDYGLNHFRFHSWCPPKAAFEAADEIGFYLQAELPHWNLEVGSDSLTNLYLYTEAERILAEYGNHPSFVLMSLGNELMGKMSFLNAFTAQLKSIDPRRLYSTTTFSFQEDAGSLPQPEDEFYVTQWTKKGWVRGQGIFNDYPPNFNTDYRDQIDHITQPLLSHEIGQYSVFPDLAEIDKYTAGVLDPLNFKAVRNDLAQKGMLELAPDFTSSSVALANILYKEEIERALKTPGFDGFQLLQLQDFPGQGTALVGLLNAFWEPKGDIKAEEFKRFCGPVVPLLRFSKAVYAGGETFEGSIQIANFYQPLSDQTVEWRIEKDGEVLDSGVFENVDLSIGNENFIGEFSTQLPDDGPTGLYVIVSIQGTDFYNGWQIWVYTKAADISPGEVVYTRNFGAAAKALQEGRKVLLNPDYEQLSGVTGRFVPVFWSPVHFPDQPATMGILCDPEHAAFADFPTEAHTNWQWWELNKKSKALVLDDLEVDPIVRVIDNFVTNRELGSVFEAKVGEGQLVFTSIDLATALDQRHAARQFRTSLTQYMESADFAPQKSVTLEQIKTTTQSK